MVKRLRHRQTRCFRELSSLLSSIYKRNMPQIDHELSNIVVFVVFDAISVHYSERFRS